MKEINEEITLEFSYNQDKETINCHKKEKIKNIFLLYNKIKNIDFNTVYFLCEGSKIENLDQTFEELGKKKNFFSFIVTEYPKSVWIIFSHSNDLYKEERDAGDTFKDIFSNYAEKKKINENKLKFKYKGYEVNTKKTINEFLKDNDELYLKKKKEIMSEKCEQKVDEKENPNKNEKMNDTVSDMNVNENENEIEIKIDVIDVPFCPTFYKNHRKSIMALIIILSIIVIVGITVLIVLLLKGDSNKGSNSSSSSSTYSIPTDYFIKATYISTAGENVRLISDVYNLNKIQKLNIDGNTIAPTKHYDFKDEGEHIIYFSFNNYTSNSSLYEGSWIFSGIENLKSVEFSSYIKIFPDVKFKGMFNNCKNLESVDLSKIKLYSVYSSIDYYECDDDCIDYYDYVDKYFEYLNSMEYMFNNCFSLKTLNFDIKLPDLYCINVNSQKFMFNNCTSLTYIFLPSLCFFCFDRPSFEINNMFYNCFSLKMVNIYSISGVNNNYTNMSYIFYNCSSLVSFDVSLISLAMPNDMSYAFTNCSSLKSLDLHFIIDQYSRGKTMSNAFRNCTNLVSININFLDYEDMSYAFKNCFSLKEIEIYYFNEKNVKYMNSLFSGCYDLESIDFLSVPLMTYELIDISYMFFDCFSLKKAICSFLITDKIINYGGIFYGCDNLEIIDISSFSHNNLPDLKLSIFSYFSYYNATLFVNEEFLNRIEIPRNLNIVIKNKTYINK